MGEYDAGDRIIGKVSGPVSGQVAIGKDIRQTQVSGPPPTAADIADLRAAFEALREQIQAEGGESAAAARERVDELEGAVIAEQPDLSTMEYVKGWFARTLPKLAGIVASIFVHPVVGKIVWAAGEAVASEFERRIGPVPAPKPGSP